MIGADELLLALQFDDSFFPSGAGAHSYGLEGLRELGQLGSAGDVEGFLAVQLEERWASSDRALLLHAHAACPDLERVAALDELCERTTLVESWRSGGRRLGRAQLRLHVRW